MIGGEVFNKTPDILFLQLLYFTLICIYLDSSAPHLASPAWYNAYAACVVVVVCMSVYVMERGNNESGDRGGKGVIAVMQCNVVCRC